MTRWKPCNQGRARSAFQGTPRKWIILLSRRVMSRAGTPMPCSSLRARSARCHGEACAIRFVALSHYTGVSSRYECRGSTKRGQAGIAGLVFYSCNSLVISPAPRIPPAGLLHESIMPAVEAITEKLLEHCRTLDQRIKLCHGRELERKPDKRRRILIESGKRLRRDISP